jgi:hypothetical protein
MKEMVFLSFSLSPPPPPLQLLDLLSFSSFPSPFSTPSSPSLWQPSSTSGDLELKLLLLVTTSEMDASGDLEIHSADHLLSSDHLLSLPPAQRCPRPWFPNDDYI